ncbi:MAG: hypothetical protein KGI97_03985 [Alphaproteobacteria bacterium]|nr:hypothetical protein [Alphaproteobacteria bacterium]
MPRKRKNRRFIVSIDNPELADSAFFAQACKSSLPVLAIACELAYEAGFTDLAALHQRSPDIAGKICDTARTALHGLQKLEARDAARKRLH